MKIAVFTDAYPPQQNGLSLLVYMFAKEMAKRDHDVHVFAPKEKERPPAEGVTVHPLPSVPLWFYPEYRTSLPFPTLHTLRFMGNDFDIVHSHSMFLMGLRAYVSAKAFGLPLLGSFDTIISENVRSVSSRLEPHLKGAGWALAKAYYDHCTRVLALTPSVKKILIERGFRRPIDVVPAGVDVERFAEADGGRIRRELGLGNEKTVIYMGRLSPEKRVEDLIHAMDDVNATLVICGDGPLKASLQRLSSGRKVIFTGHIPWEKTADYYKAGDVFALPSIGETQGLVILEAMASGVPVVATRSQGPVDLIEDGMTGLLAQPRSPRSLSDCINTLLNSESLRESMARNASKKVREYEWDRCAERLERTYADVIESTCA